MIEHRIGNSNGNFHYNAFIYTDTCYNTHFHSSYELIYAIDGFCNISVDGTFYTLEEGELFLISPYTIHSFDIVPGNKTWIGVFSEDFISDFAKINRYKKYGRFRCDNNIEEFLKKELFFQGQPEHYMLISCLYMVCNECEKNSDFYDTKIHNKFIHDTIRYISQNLSDNITLAKLSEILGYEYHYFSILFNRCFSTNFKTFINMFRFQQACNLIADKNISITEICEKCGFGSIRNFNRVFKAMSGHTPSEFRKLSHKTL